MYSSADWPTLYAPQVLNLARACTNDLHVHVALNFVSKLPLGSAIALLQRGSRTQCQHKREYVYFRIIFGRGSLFCHLIESSQDRVMGNTVSGVQHAGFTGSTGSMGDHHYRIHLHESMVCVKTFTITDRVQPHGGSSQAGPPHSLHMRTGFSRVPLTPQSFSSSAHSFAIEHTQTADLQRSGYLLRP